MSLINQLLQDLEKRRASGAETRALSPRVRALPGRAKRGALLAAGVLAAAAVAAVGLLAYWEYAKPLATPVVAAPPALPAKQVTAAPVAPPAAEEARVREALTVAVFQLAEELQFAPAGAPSRSARPAPATGPAPAQRKTPIVKAPPAPGDKTPGRPAKASPAPAEVQAPASAPDMQHVVIAEGPAPVPVEKQMREPTAYERAELEFRNAVGRLRQGRAVDAEAGFRSALKEDQSHAAARQALISLLIDAGRYADAEEVLRETLTVNPRQPRHAMLLARLELERGDAPGAAKTLESVRQYTGVDAEFYAFLAAVYQRIGRHKEAADLYMAALAVEPGNAVWLMGLGISLQALHRSEQARSAYRSAVDSKRLSAELQAFVEARLRELSPR